MKRFAQRLSIESDRLIRITHEIIELSRLQAADALANAERIDIDRVIAKAIDAQPRARRLAPHRAGQRRRRRRRGVRRRDDARDRRAQPDRERHPVLADGSRVGIGVSQRDGVVEIAVTDQGVGIPEAERDRVFERFFRVDSARSRNTGGTGLGLSIVKHVVQNHGGDVRVWSQQGRGSTFTIRLPEASHATAASLGVAQ